MEDFAKAAKELEERVKKAREEFEAQQKKLEEDKIALEKEKQTMSERYPINESIIELNVGGKKFTTFKSTLCKKEGSMLQAMFSGRHQLAKDSKGRYFIDRSGREFELILNYLRTGKLQMPSSADDRERLMTELEYFGLLEDLIVVVKGFGGTTILNEKQQQQLNEWYGNKNQEWELIYKATRDSFRAQDFHQKCDGQGPTVTVIQANNYIFGGYNTDNWHSNNRYTNPAGCWLFSLTNPSNTPMKIPCGNNAYSIYGNPSHGPTFGGGYDVYIADNANVNASSYTNLGHTYSVNINTDKRTFLCGSYNFTPSEIEVFKPKAH